VTIKSTAAQVYNPTALLNGYNHFQVNVLESMVPHQSYFIEFPTGNGYKLPTNPIDGSQPLKPLCGDQSPFSFLFRKGSKEHYRKLIVEFEGGPACLNRGGGCDLEGQQVPWHDYVQSYNDSDDQALPRLGSCNGVVPGILNQLSLFPNTIATDLPLLNRTSSPSDASQKPWWETLTADSSSSEHSLHDWSYILIPHCTKDWHLGYAERVSFLQFGTTAPMHRGGANRDAVLAWILRQFGGQIVEGFADWRGSEGLQGLVTLAGGRLGGCDEFKPESASSSLAAATFASQVAAYFKKMESALVLVEGASLFYRRLPEISQIDYWNPKDLMFDLLPYAMRWVVASAPDSVHFAWAASSSSSNCLDETLEAEIIQDMEREKPENFHLYVGPTSSRSGTCPKYAFSNDYESYGSFLEEIVGQLSWSYTEGPHSDLGSTDDSNRITLGFTSVERLSFLAVAMIVLGIIVAIWLVYFVLKRHRLQQNLDPPMAPHKLWLHALTHYPRCFLVLSLILPCCLSLVAFSRAGYTIPVNLDFETYLDIANDVNIVSDNYDMALQYQEASTNEAEATCRDYGDSEVFKPEPKKTRRAMMDSEDVMHSLFDGEEPIGRKLQQSNSATTIGSLKKRTLKVMYQNPEGGNVFTPDVLRDMYEFEQDVRNFTRYEEYCLRRSNGDCRFGTILKFLYPDGVLVGDIEGTLATKATPEKVDQFFSIPDNLASNITQSFIYFEGEGAALDSFLKEFYQDFLKKRSQENFYPNLIFTWENGFILRQEANEALLHDTLWSVGSLLMIGIMIYLKVQDFFVFFFGLLGLTLAFTTSYYWCTTHFGMPEITLLHVSGLFVMLGIGADDIFLMVDSFEHAKVAMEEDKGSEARMESDIGVAEDVEQSYSTGPEDKTEIIRKQMLWAYSTAGGMMLVSSMTAAVCFFSNAFGVLLVIQEFGIYMGMVVLVNFFHVMTILPSAILVNEIYFKPWKARMCCCVSLEEISDEGSYSDPSVSNDGAPNGRNEDDFLARDNLPSKQIMAAYDGSVRLAEVIPPPELDNSPCREEGTEEEQETRFSKLGQMDKFLFHRYTPFLVQHRRPIIALSIVFALVLGIAGAETFEFSDGSILIFSNDYNQGRLTSIKNNYLDPSRISLVSINEPISSGVGSGGSGSSGGGAPGGGGSGGGSGGSGGGSGPGGGIVIPIPTPPSPTNPVTTAPAASPSGGGSGPGGGIITPIPTPSPTNPVTTAPTASPSVSLSDQPPNLDPGIDSEPTKLVETSVKLLWGISSQSADTADPWRVKSSTEKSSTEEKSGQALLGGVTRFDVTEPTTQQWLLDVVLAAKADDLLNVIAEEPTWIEMLADFAKKQDHGFPIQKELFMTYVEILKSKNTTFDELVEDEIGTSLAGLAGDTLYTSVTMQSSGPTSLGFFDKWTTFANTMNERSPTDVQPMVAHSDLFWNDVRAQETIDATVRTWLFANLLCGIIILLFTQNLMLCMMVMVTIFLMFMCIAGWLFAVLDRPLGPIQALGISIFIGLSANYSLHIVHAYHRSSCNSREEKVKQAVFITGSPICASAISTIGGCVFLFGCRAIPLVELGILICCVTAMALIYSMGFLLAWLSVMGPLPYEDRYDSSGRRLHRWDISSLFFRFTNPTTTNHSIPDGK